MSIQARTPFYAIIFWIAFGVLVGWLIHPAGSKGTELIVRDQTEQEQEQPDLDLFWDVWEDIDENYFSADDSSDQERIYGAIDGLVDSLEDPYSVFLDPEETSQFLTGLNGELEGIGAELTVQDGLLVVVSPLKSSPAEREGLLPQDHIYKVDGESTGEMSLWEAITKIRGERGTEVALTILREGESDPLEITIVRESIQVPSVESKFVEEEGKSLAFITINQFSEDTYQEFKNVVRETLLQEVEGMVLDLRRNGGGYLQVSLQMLGEFFEEDQKGVAVNYRDRDTEVMYTDGNGRLKDIPLVVLIDQGSASASEIVAGALQDLKRATLVGQTSFGKGSVQELVELQDGSTLRLTIAKWFTPNGRGIDKVGIDPDVFVEMEPSAIGTEEDLQFNAALQLLLQQL